MCLIDDGDGRVTMIDDGGYVRARAKHKCKECFRFIEPGETYHREVFKFEGEFSTHKTCAHCMVVRGWLQDECGGWLYGGVEEDAREHVFDNRGYYGVDLYRAVVGMQWQWRTPSGRRMRVPNQIKTSDEMRAAAGRVE